MGKIVGGPGDLVRTGMDGAVHVVEICNHNRERARESHPSARLAKILPTDGNAHCPRPGGGMYAKTE